MTKRQNLNPLVAAILGTLWVLIVIAGYITLGILIDNATGAWWGGGIFVMVGLSALPFAIYGAVNNS